MYLFAHLGLGYLAVRPWWWRVPVGPLLLGCLLPDLIDKPLYYGLASITGRHGAELGLISGTRTFAHTGIFFLLLVGVALVLKSRPGLALALGVLTHLLLDALNDYLADTRLPFDFSRILWPLRGWSFPIMPYPNFATQLHHWLDSKQLRYEAMGLIVLGVLLLRTWSRRPRAKV